MPWSGEIVELRYWICRR